MKPIKTWKIGVVAVVFALITWALWEQIESGSDQVNCLK